MRSKKELILELSDNAVKVCQVNALKKKRHIRALEIFTYPQRISSKDITDVFLKFTKKIKYSRIIISLPRQFFLIRFLKFPSQNINEIKKMIPFQMAKKVIQPLDDILYDSALVETQEQGYAKIILFITQKKRISNLLEFIQQNKINLSAITISSWGLSNWLVFQRYFFKEELNYPIAVIDVNALYAEFLVESKEGIIFSRAFQYFSEEELFDELEQSRVIFEKEFGKQKFLKIIFTGKKREKFIEKLNWPNSVFINHLENFSADKEVMEKMKDSDFSFASVMGAAVSSEPPLFDFSPEFLKERNEGVKRKNRYLKIALLAGEVIFILGILIGKYVWEKYAYADFLDSKLQEIKIEAKELSRVTDKLKIIDKEFSKQYLFSEILYDLISSIPQNTQLTLLEFKDNGDFSIKGYAQSDTKVFAIKTALSKSKLFRNVRIKYASKIKKDNNETVEFYIYGENNSIETGRENENQSIF